MAGNRESKGAQKKRGSPPRIQAGRRENILLLGVGVLAQLANVIHQLPAFLL